MTSLTMKKHLFENLYNDELSLLSDLIVYTKEDGSIEYYSSQDEFLKANGLQRIEEDDQIKPYESLRNIDDITNDRISSLEFYLAYPR